MLLYRVGLRRQIGQDLLHPILRLQIQGVLLFEELEVLLID